MICDSAQIMTSSGLDKEDITNDLLFANMFHCAEKMFLLSELESMKESDSKRGLVPRLAYIELINGLKDIYGEDKSDAVDRSIANHIHMMQNMMEFVEKMGDNLDVFASDVKHRGYAGFDKQLENLVKELQSYRKLYSMYRQTNDSLI